MEFLLVFFQIALEHKWFPAMFTREGTVVCVHAEVLKYILLLGEFFVAVLILALEGGWVSVCLIVKDFFKIVPLSWNTVESFHLLLLSRILDLRGRVSAVSSLGLIMSRNSQVWTSLTRYVILTFKPRVACHLVAAVSFLCHLWKKQSVSRVFLRIWGVTALVKLWMVRNGCQPNEILNRLWNNPGRLDHMWDTSVQGCRHLRLVIKLTWVMEAVLVFLKWRNRFAHILHLVLLLVVLDQAKYSLLLLLSIK